MFHSLISCTALFFQAFNQYVDGRSGEIRSREVNGRLVLEGALRIHWGVKGVIHLKENDDQRTVVTIRKRNSCRYSVGKSGVVSPNDSINGDSVIVYLLFSSYLHYISLVGF